MFVLVAMFRSSNGDIKIGAAYGPYETKDEANNAKDRKDFPMPELVEIVRLWV